MSSSGTNPDENRRKILKVTGGLIGVAGLTGGLYGNEIRKALFGPDYVEEDELDDRASEAGGDAGEKAAEEEMERSFQQIKVSGLDYDMVETGLDYVEDELGSEYSEEIVRRRQFDLWGENDDVDYLEGEITWRVNENRESIARHQTDREDREEKWTGRHNTRFDTARTFLEGIDQEYDENLLEEYSNEEPNEADLQHLANLGYDEEVLEQYDEW